MPDKDGWFELDGKQMRLVTEEHLACPFCGGSHLWLHRNRRFPEGDPDEPDAWEFYVVCGSCAAHGGWDKSDTGAFRLWGMRVQ